MKNSAPKSLLFLSTSLLLWSSCNLLNSESDPANKKQKMDPKYNSEKNFEMDQVQGEKTDAEVQRKEEKVEIEELIVGKGAEATPGKEAVVRYVGSFENGKIFDSSKKRGKPFSFSIGEGRLIEGWEQGVLGMRVGGKRRVKIPPSLAYGKRGISGVIPPSSTLIFDIELIKLISIKK